MRSFQTHLQKELEDEAFKKGFNEFKSLLNLSGQINKHRLSKRWSSEKLAIKAGIDKKQFSNIENASDARYAVSTLLKICDALGLEIVLKKRTSR
jgi:DNA-binding Xre family transcriptional regulator